MTGKVQLTGFKELDAKLAELPDRIGRAAAVRGMKKASTVMKDEQERLAPVDDGALAGSIVVKAKSRNLTGLAEFGQTLKAGGSHKDAVVALRDARRSGDSKGTRITVNIGPSAPHARLVELGTAPRFQKTTGKYVGIMPAQPFVRPAFDNQKGNALNAIKREITVEIGKAKGRLDRKAAKLAGLG